MRAYHSGLTVFREVNTAIKSYKSHQKVLDSEAAGKKFKPYEKKKELLRKRFDDFFLAKEMDSATPSPFDYDDFVNDFTQVFQMINMDDDYDSDFNVDVERFSVDNRGRGESSFSV
jgi:hypothetical protein